MKKLADKWDGTLYTVVSKNKYQIRSPSGGVKTVHKNLIMPVNFLPLPETDEEDEHMSLSGDSMSVAGSSQSSVDDDTDDRTVRWVASLTGSSGTGSSDTGDLGPATVDRGDVIVPGLMSGTRKCLSVFVCDSPVCAVSDMGTVEALSIDPLPSVSSPTYMDVPTMDVSLGLMGPRSRQDRLSQ